MGSGDRKGNSFKKVYLYLLGLGLLFFGVFAMLFRTYEHPIYGHINFGQYHLVIGAGFILLATAFLLFIRNRF
jgi:FtsH-binding integral membrane protein